MIPPLPNHLTWEGQTTAFSGILKNKCHLPMYFPLNLAFPTLKLRINFHFTFYVWKQMTYKLNHYNSGPFDNVVPELRQTGWQLLLHFFNFTQHQKERKEEDWYFLFCKSLLGSSSPRPLTLCHQLPFLLGVDSVCTRVPASYISPQTKRKITKDKKIKR